MRFAQFELVKYGNFADQKIDFAGGQSDIHLVYGANEAGKTMFRHALYDFLFGFENQSKANFKFNYNELLLRASIEHDGVQQHLERIKGKNNTLRDQTQKPIDEKILAEQLAGIDQEQYEQEFAIDGENLRTGIERLVNDSDRFSEALYETVSGMKNASSLIKQLDELGQRTWAKHKGKKTSYRDANRRYESAVQESNVISVKSEDLLSAHAVLDRVKLEAERIKKRLQALQQQIGQSARAQGAADQAKQQLKETQDQIAEAASKIRDIAKQLGWQKTDIEQISAKLAPSSERAQLVALLDEQSRKPDVAFAQDQRAKKQAGLSTTEKLVPALSFFGVLGVAVSLSFIYPDLAPQAQAAIFITGAVLGAFAAAFFYTEQRRAHRSESKADEAAKLEQVKIQKARLVERCSIAQESSDESIRQALAQLEQLAKLIEKHERLTAQCKKQRTDVDSLDKPAPTAPSESEADLEKQSKILIEQLEAAEREVAIAQSNVATHENAEQKAADVEQRKKDSLAAMGNAVREHLRARFGEAILRSALKKYLEKNEKPLLADACKNISILTENRFVRMKYDDESNELRLVKHDDEIGNGLKMDELSTGTFDQAYLALRLAGLRGEIRAGKVLPFVADDVFVHFDDGRAEAGFKLLAEIAKETQVIYLTHHEHLIDIAKKAFADVNILRLPDPQEAKS